MASPVHRYLFSPPSSPPAIQGSHSPLLEPLESFHAINRSTTVPLLAAVAPTTRYQDFEKLSLVGGKKVRVTDHHGAPRTLLYSKTAQESHGMAIAPPERVSRPTHHHHQVPPLTPAQEVLALQSYLLASPHHALPPNTRPLEPLDPMTLVGFQATGGGWKELERDVEPLVVYSFSKTWTRPVLELLSLYALDPQPVVFSVEGRADAPVLAETLARLVPSRSPAAASEAVITIAGKPINGYAQLEKLHRAGKLHGMLERAGAVVDGLRRKEEGERARRGRLVKRLKHAQIKVVRGDQDGEDEAE
ncbi:hypothetical protein QFC19_002468 [Naganishia cerealis]|uniref:Uncharacterized protein n=1 Tax=Naganishia cerealis TaxID=610337 RepID=A0ACC2WBI6_9TREE|nr:hypothetical protein QFC19_002468 [Naganishia cerealis]